MRLSKGWGTSPTWRSAIGRPGWPCWTITPVTIGCRRSWDAAPSVDGAATSARRCTTTWAGAIGVPLGRRATLRLGISIGIGRSITLIVAILIITIVTLTLVVILAVLLGWGTRSAGVLALWRRSRWLPSVTSLVGHICADVCVQASDPATLFCVVDVG